LSDFQVSSRNLIEQYNQIKIKATKILRTLVRHDCLWCGLPINSVSSIKNKSFSSIDLCKECQQGLSRNLVCCECCAIPLDLTESHLGQQKIMCGQCQSQSPPWQRAVVCFNYTYPVDRFLMALKYKGRVDIARCMANLMSEDLKHSYDFTDRKNHIPSCLIPVPLHPLRETSRGYNQATLLARILGQKLDIPVNDSLIERSRHTPRQSSLTKTQRSKNLRKAFQVRASVKVPEFVAIIDDVMTTGSTVESVCKTLLQVGVKRVDVWCCARAD